MDERDEMRIGRLWAACRKSYAQKRSPAGRPTPKAAAVKECAITAAAAVALPEDSPLVAKDG